jgi:hypothetical protein
MSIADEPVDARRGKRAAKRRRDRNRVHDVAKRPQTHEKNAVHLLISVVRLLSWYTPSS